MTRSGLFVAAVVWAALPASAQETPIRGFVGGGVGLSNLSADGSTASPTDSSLRVSGYKPETGIAAAAVGGLHLTRFVSVQGAYFFNRNRIRFSAFEGAAGQLKSFETESHLSSHAVVSEVLVYVRPRGNWLRPYLSAGVGAMRLRVPAGSNVGRGDQSLGGPGAISSAAPLFRVGVGMDVVARNGWGFRFMFGQTLRSNAVSDALGIRPARRYATFHNVFGIVKYF